MRKPDRRIAWVTMLVTLGLVVFAAGNAVASGDQLYILPHDEHGNLAFRDVTILIVLFTALVYPLNALIFRPIFRVLDAREEKTSGTRKRADQLAADAQVMLERYENSIREVRHDAEASRKQTLSVAREEGAATTTRARGEAEAEVARAREEIARALDDARATLARESTALAGAVAERALGRTLS